MNYRGGHEHSTNPFDVAHLGHAEIYSIADESPDFSRVFMV